MEEQIQELDKQQLNEVMQFANGLYNGFGSYGFYSNPYIQYQNLVKVNNNPQVPTYEKLLKALETAPYDYKALVAYSEFMEIFDNIYRKTLDYHAGLLAMDIHYVPRKNVTIDDLNSQDYKDDFARIEKFLSTFDYKQEFRKIVKEVLRRETSYVWFRDSHSIDSPIDIEDKAKKNEKYALQIMPQNYCMLTGYFDNSQPLYDFDMNYFLKGTVDINLFDPSFKKKFREVFGDGSQTYIPSAQLSGRNGEFATWSQCSPADGAYAFKLDLSNFRQVPVFSGLMKSAIDNNTIEQLQKNKNLIGAYLIMMGEMRLMDNAKSGDKPNQWAITPKTVGELINLITTGLKDYQKIVSLPLENTREVQYQDYNKDMVNTHLNQVAGQGASANSMIYSSTKMGQFELQQAIENDFSLLEPLYNQFAQFMNYFVNRKLRKYKFDFSFTGINRSFYRDAKFKQLTQMAQMGIVMDESMWASCYEMKPQDFRKSVMMANTSGFTQFLTPLMSLNNAKDGMNTSGNPTKDNSELKDNGAIAREQK